MKMSRGQVLCLMTRGSFGHDRPLLKQEEDTRTYQEEKWNIMTGVTNWTGRIGRCVDGMYLEGKGQSGRRCEHVDL